MIIFWGSQSGTAEGFANRLAQELPRSFQLGAIAADLSDYDAETIALLPRSRIAIFILTTYGEGDPSDNACSFCDWLAQMENNVLSSLRYAAFGLGNSNDRHYNRVVDRVTAKLEQYGAERLMPVGKGDAREGTTEEDFLAWKDTLCDVFRERLGFTENTVTETRREPAFKIVEDDSLDLSDLHSGHPIHTADSGKSGAISPIRPLKVRQSRELFASSSRNCLHIEFDISNVPEITYKTGDHLAVWPINQDQEVDRIINVLGLSGKRATPILISSLDPAVKVKIPSPTSIDALFRYYLEVGTPVSRATVRELASFAPSQATKEFLLGLSRDRNTFANLLSRTHVTVGRLLEMASKAAGESPLWKDISLSYLVETFPRTQPRYYSISSSSITAPRAPCITALVANAELLTGSAAIPGLATNYLLSLSNSLSNPRAMQNQTDPSKEEPSYALSGPSESLAGGLVHAHVRRSKFKLPALSSCPIIMVAAGTGIAPFRAFVMERTRLLSIGKPVGKMLLIFGCRRPDEDYIYRNELEQATESLHGSLEIVTAFSRTDGMPKTYVQDRVHELGIEVSELVGEDASIYICGRASMAREVGKAICEVIKAQRGWKDEEALEWSAGMKRTRKWQEDVWG